MVSSDCDNAESIVQFGPSTRALMQYPRSLYGMAFHEAAHAVAGILHGGTLTEARIIPGRVKAGVLGGPRGSTTFTGLAATRHPEVAFAGVWGQARGIAGRRPGWHEIRAALDGTGCHDKQVLTAAGGESAGDAITPLLERCWPSVAELAAKLHQTGKVSHADVLAALRLSADPDTRALETAAIKSGMAPGSFTVSRPS